MGVWGFLISYVIEVLVRLPLGVCVRVKVVLVCPSVSLRKVALLATGRGSRRLVAARILSSVRRTGSSPTWLAAGGLSYGRLSL